MPKNSLDKKGNSLLRPVGARALKSSLDTLRPYLKGASVLDLFAGQGRFAYGALAEGAKSALLVEQDPKTSHQLKELRPKKIPKERISQVICDDVWRFLKQAPEHLYDVIFVDPPFQDFSENLLEKLLLLLEPHSHSNTILLVKTPSEMLISTQYHGFTLWKATRFGEAQLAYFTYGESQNS